MLNKRPSCRVFRFVNDIGGPHSPDFRSPKSLLKPRDLKRKLESGLSIAEELCKLKDMSKQHMANLTAAGELRMTSPMIPVLEDPHKALMSTYQESGDPFLRTIIRQARFLAILDVPCYLLYKPHTYEAESELMVLSQNIWKFLIEVRDNPYRL